MRTQSRTIAAQHKEKAPQTGLFRLVQICRNYMRESSDTPKLNAFCRVAPTLRFNAFAIFSAPVFFLAMAFKVRTFSPVQARLALFFIGSLPLCEVFGVSAEKAGVNAYGQFFTVDSRSTVKHQTNGRYLPLKLLEIAPRTLANASLQEMDQEILPELLAQTERRVSDGEPYLLSKLPPDEL
jgi:hypothetical protein